jgi:flagellar motility protein MotE (MotC chaperone)
MANHLRLLPLIAVAVGGVIAVRAVGSIEAMPAFLKSATAWAEAPKADGEAKKGEAKKGEAKPKPEKANSADDTATDAAESAAGSVSGDDKALSVLDAAQPAAAKAAPVCATSVDDLAKQAGMSPSELKVIQALAQRRAELDAREKQMATQEQLIAAAESKLDGRIKQLGDLKTQVQALLDQANKTGDDDVARMVKVYESMKPKDAAKVMETLKDDVRLPIASKMKERNLAAMLAQMQPDKARDLTEKLAQRMKKADDLQNRLDKVNAAGAAPATPAPAKK